MNDFTDSFLARGFESLINNPNRRTDTSASCIDHIYKDLGLNAPLVLFKLKCPTIMHYLPAFRSLKGIYFRDQLGESHENFR